MAAMLVDDSVIPAEQLEYFFLVRTSIRSFNLEHYYEAIKDWTFPTQFIPISSEQARVWRKQYSTQKLSKEEEARWAAVEDALKAALARYPSGGFVKLSSRSPKDAVDKLPHLVQLIAQELKAERQREAQAGIRSGNFDAEIRLRHELQHLHALRRAFFLSMKVKSLKEAKELFLGSMRTCNDIARALQVHDANVEHKEAKKWELNIIVRQFEPIVPGGELRGFIHKCQLTAVTQYDLSCEYDVFRQGRDELKQRLLTYFDKVKLHIPYESCIIDFALIEGSAADIKIVEINPWGPMTGSGLYDWVKDKHELENGPLKIRFVEAGEVTYENAHSRVLPWAHLVKEAEALCAEQPAVPPASEEKCTVC